MNKFLLIVCLTIFSLSSVLAANRTVNLTVAYKTVNFAGKTRQAMAVNNQIPAPTLHFKEGDHVTINVLNNLDQDTAIHWHGIIIPWQMDGVEGISQKGIPPGKVFHYQFTLHQSGTYWYHAHAGLQEQEGYYGAFLIDPLRPPHYKYAKDYVVVLSDWSNTEANQIFYNLKKEGDYYSPRFPLQPSLVKFIHDYQKASAEERKKILDDYKMMQQMRMGTYDFSDVAYDAFLLNGHPNFQPWTAPVKLGDTVRLRFIGAGGSTIFNVKIPGTTMKMVHIQGNDVKPYDVNYFKIAPGETIDVLVKIKKLSPYIIYAESIDTLGAAYGALVTSPNQFVNYQQVTPFPEPQPVMREMMKLMMQNDSSMNMNSMGSMKMGSQSSHHMAGMSHDMKMGTGMKMDHSMPMKAKKVTTKYVSKNSSSQKSSDMSMEEQMKMNPNMKMDSSMPMNHTMPVEDKKVDTKPVTKSSNSQMPSDMSMQEKMKMDPDMKMDHDSMNHSMPMDDKKVDAKPVTKSSNPQMPSGMSMQEKMKMDPNMKMDSSMPMNHTMPMESKKNNIKSVTKNSNLHASHSKMSSDMKMAHGRKMGPNMKMNHGMKMDDSMNMDMPTEPSIIGDTIASPSQTEKAKTVGFKYQDLRAVVKTNNPDKKVDGIIRMELFGYMERFIWFINGLPEYKAHPIILEPNKRYRFIFTNTSMMRHPMHIHGHWFILRNGHGSYDPLLHTLDISPGATVTADVDTDASGQWFFHCHLLYHMMAGMSRTFQYSTLLEISKGEAIPQNVIKQTAYYNRPIVRVDEARPIDLTLVHHPMAHLMGLYLASFLDVGADPFNNVQKVNFKGLYGQDYNKIELFTNDAEVKKGVVENTDMDIFYWHLLDQFWSIKGGVNYFYRPAERPYWQPGIGIEGLMPYFIDTNIRSYLHSGSLKLDVEFSRDSQITNNFFIRLGIRSILASKTIPRAEIGSGINQMRYIVRPYYRVMPGLNIFAEYEHEQNYGAFKTLQSNSGEPSSQDTVTFGLGILF